MRWAFLAAWLFASWPAHAQELAVYGFGNMPCSGWLYAGANAKTGTAEQTMRSGAEMWALGYLSAANWYELHLSPNGPLTADSVFAWVDSYCGKHPADRLNIAMLALVATTKPKR